MVGIILPRASYKVEEAGSSRGDPAMTHAQLGPVVRHLRHLAGTPGHHDLSDTQLLQCFAARHEEAAFAALVERHGRLVLNVCRRVLGHEQDAEDAFQATFLLLARNAASIHTTEAVGGWLYRVAHRVATRAGVGLARRRAREREAGARRPREAPSDAAWRELQEVLQEELARLPEKYREPFVLCCLEGKSGAEAAALLGWKPGTVTGRLTKARRLLQQRLARRGVVLSAVLTAAALSTRGTAAAVPAALVRQTVRAVLLPPTGAVPAPVAALVGGTAPALSATRARLAVALVLAVSLAAGAGVLTRPAAPPAASAAVPAREIAAPADRERSPAAAPNPGDATVTLTGRVLGPDGRPFAGARLYLWTNAIKKSADLRVRATTGADGRFRFAAARSDLRRNAKVVAAAEGLGPDWLGGGAHAKGGELTLRLVRDDVPVTGRILDLEGQPIAGAAVEVTDLEAPTSGNLAGWIETRRQWARGNYVSQVPMKNLTAAALGVPTSVTTDREGRFRLAGFGRERVVNLRIHGQGLETSRIEVLTRPGPLTGVRTGDGGTYPAAFVYHVGPSKPIVGTVRDKKTGKPVAGITVHGAASPGGRIGGTEEAAVTTDAAGKYRLDGVGKCAMYWIAAEGLPYFNSTKLEVKDSAGLDPLTIDFDLERGVAVTGRLTDKVTGQPVKGYVRYLANADNPNLKDYTELTKLHVEVRSYGDTGPDGAFTVLAIPGPGLLTVVAEDRDRYIGAEIPGWDGFLLRTVPGSIHPSQFHAVVPIHPAEGDPKSTTCAIALEPGQTRHVTVVGPDGKPVTGALVAGLTPLATFPAVPGLTPAMPSGLKGADVTVLGLGRHQVRNVVFFQPEKKLGTIEPVRGDETGPVTVRLEPLGGATGRVLDARGRPWPGLRVEAGLTRLITAYKDLPWAALSNLRPSLKVVGTTDRDGRFRLAGLLPGLKYDLIISEGGIKPGPVTAYRKDVTVESGKTRDVGDLRSEQSQGK
jgi:RNA polymerase sigma factor (sigma-70 family)